MRKCLHIVLLLVAVTACHGPRVIPRDRMADIYFDMFMADQQVKDDPLLHVMADSMLVYEAVFNRYGYDTDDYLYSVRHYLKDPERFAKIAEEVASRLKGEAESMDKVIAHADWLNKYGEMRRPSVDSLLWIFCDDSVYVGLARAQRDSSRYGGWFRLVSVRPDTLKMPWDTLKVPADSMSVRKAFARDAAVAKKEAVVNKEAVAEREALVELEAVAEEDAAENEEIPEDTL